MNFSALSIRHPVPALLLFAMLCVLGLLGLRALPIQNFPDITFPTVTVSATLEGAAPSQLETDVARKIEDKLASLGQVKHVQTVITDGSVNINITFEIEKDSNEALNDVRNAVDSVRPELPADMNPPVVSRVTTTGSAILTYVVQGDGMDEQELSWFIDNDIARAMLAVKGVGSVTRIGGVSREVQVDLDPALMNGLGVTVSDVSNALKGMQKDASGGRGDIGGNVQSMRTLGAVGSPAEIAAISVPLSSGKSVRLDQVAHIKDGIAERASYARLDGKPVIAFNITRIKGASEVSTASGVREAIARFSQEHPTVKIDEAFNGVNAIEDNYIGSMHLLYEGALLAVLVVWWFLRDIRATLVSATALPLSMIPTFAAMHYLGFSLNVLTLLAMALVVGILVDDAIVEIENIVRHLRMGKTPFQAAMEAADEIGLAVIATTFTLVAVFLPTAFMAGVPGQFFKPFGMTAAIAVLMSLLVARLLTPMMAAYLLKPHEVDTSDSRIMTMYLKVVHFCLTHRKTTMAAAVAFFIGSIALIPLLPTGFVPAADIDQTQVSLEMQPGTNLDETLKVSELAVNKLKDIPEITRTFIAAGTAKAADGIMTTTTSDTRKATLNVILKPRSDRSRKQSEVEKDIRKALADLPGARVVVGGAGAGDELLEITLTSDDARALDDTVRKVAQEVRGIPGLGNITSSAGLPRPEVQIRPDYARAAELGVTSVDIATVVRAATNGDFSTAMPKLNLPQRQVPIRVRLQRSVREDIDAIAQLRVPGRNGPVPISAIATIGMGNDASEIDRLDRQRNITLKVELNGHAMGEIQRQVAKLPTLQKLPPQVHRQTTGSAERQGELFASFGTAMLIGVLCIYCVLVLLFHDFMQPATVLAALPLSMGGAFLALLVTGKSFSFPAVIGLLMLMGVVTKNSILLVEYAILARHRGASRFDALLDACHKRARPIVMTTIAMGAGMLPTAMGLGAEPSFRSPMAIALIGGLLTSTMLSLLVVPVVFTYVDDVLRWVKSWLPKPHGHEEEMAGAPQT
ncbi:ACR/RND family transmembrane transporter [Novimethylophilus kurashikiensis]|uniref:ACR/RND family transmembrane transporter n=1 Tax=Novimethylophilus kurashikiensis TaxID=1825523 RepID=A0A2R5F4D8_9PROT|nr:efflux RND transporter permease subunit [Novimethylophilus kurashikiensis]GBG13095.1 ACR/RND family transmembrane transporter [Novimethylophilus kurashikiensis]